MRPISHDGRVSIARLVGACLLLLGTGWAAEAQLRAQPYVSGLSMPLAIVTDPRDRTVQFVVEQIGRIRVVQNGVLLDDDFLDIRGAVLCCGERGLFSTRLPARRGDQQSFLRQLHAQARRPHGRRAIPADR